MFFLRRETLSNTQPSSVGRGRGEGVTPGCLRHGSFLVVIFKWAIDYPGAAVPGFSHPTQPPTHIELSASCHNELTVILLHVCVRKFSLGAKSLVHRWWKRGRECTSPADPAVKLVNCLERFRCESQKNKDDKRQAQYLTLHSPQTTKGPQDLFVWSFITYNGSLYSHLVVVECCISTQLTTHNTCVIQKPFWNTFIINQNIITTCIWHWLKRIRMLTSVDSFEICLIVHLHGF